MSLCAEALSDYEEALKIRRALAKENPLVMGVYLFASDKADLDEALSLLEPYPNTYANVGWLRQIIGQLKEGK